MPQEVSPQAVDVAPEKSGPTFAMREKLIDSRATLAGIAEMRV
jgi:hypothetical protein